MRYFNLAPQDYTRYLEKRVLETTDNLDAARMEIKQLVDDLSSKQTLLDSYRNSMWQIAFKKTMEDIGQSHD